MRFTWIGSADVYGGMRDRGTISSRKKNMAEMYEVFRFIDQGMRCRQSLDCVEGTLLAYYLRENPEMEKAVIFEWFRQIGRNLEQYRRCRNGKGYRYLNPYSIIVTEEERICLLNPDAPENEPAMKKMQQRAVREHFVKPVLGKNTGGTYTADLFGYGKTMQFMLAYTTVIPRLTRTEEMRLARVIGRCIGERKRQYEDLRQILKDLPEIREMTVHGKRRSRLFLLFLTASVPAGILLYTGAGPGSTETAEIRLAEENGEDDGSAPDEMQSNERKEDEGKTEENTEENTDQEGAGTLPEERVTAEEHVSAVSEELEEKLLENTAEGNAEVLSIGEELERNTLRALAAAYEREEMTEEAVSAYGRLIEIEERQELIESACIRKMNLEAGQRRYAAALLTGEKALEKLGGSDPVKEAMEGYRAEMEKEEQDEEQKDQEK